MGLFRLREMSLHLLSPLEEPADLWLCTTHEKLPSLVLAVGPITCPEACAYMAFTQRHLKVVIICHFSSHQCSTPHWLASWFGRCCCIADVQPLEEVTGLRAHSAHGKLAPLV